MGNINITYLPPENWQDFEKFVRGVVDVIWEQHGWHNYGRPGQRQAGIDLYGYDNNGKFTAIQCKKKSPISPDGEILKASTITQKDIEAEIASAEKIEDPKIERLIFATTSSRDTKLQNKIRAINNERKINNKFLVDIWFWEDFQVFIERHIELRNWYYSELLESIHKYDKNVHILLMLRNAFTRPAYSREIRLEESGADFIKAIKDTMEAITTGKLYNRRGELITTSYDYMKITNENWRKSIYDIYKELDNIRVIYQKGLVDRKIREHETCIEVLDDKLSDKFNTIRTKCLVKMNEILTELKLETIDSELIK